MTTTLPATGLETGLFRVGAGLIALRVLDDTVLQPPAGVPVSDRPFAVLVPVALLALAAWAYPRLRGAGRGALALFLGILGVATGLDAVYYATELGMSSDDLTGLVVIPGGLALIGLGAVTLWRTRRRDGWWLLRRAGLGVGGFLVASIVLMPLGIAHVETHTARAVVPAAHLGAPYENVTFESTDGLKLHGWYIPSRNGAAVISFPGRKGPQAQARILARHGYGVLVFDRRGEGRSEGQPNIFGWGGTKDIKGAIEFLKSRPDVDPHRIGGIGLSVGGELMLQAAAETRDLAAVVSEGAGARTRGEELDDPAKPGRDKPLTAIQYTFRDLGLAVSTGENKPKHLETLVPKIAPRPLLLIAAPRSPNGERLNRRYVKAAGGNATLWEIPESRHVQGIAARPAEYERRVIGFFDRAL